MIHGAEPRHWTRIAAAALLGAAVMAQPTPARAQNGPNGCDSGEIRIRFSHGEPASGAGRGDAPARLAELVNQRLNGRACMEVYFNGEMFSDDQVLAAVRRGDVEMAAPHTEKFDKIWPPLEIFDLPFMFRDASAVRWFENSGPGVRLRRDLQKVGYVGLAYWNDGMRQMSATRPLLRPEDLKGLTFGVADDEVAAAMYRGLGAKSRTVPFDDLYAALKSGKLDGQENTWAEIDRGKFDEVQAGVTETNHSVRAHLVISSAPFWSSLPEDVRLELMQTVTFVAAEQDVTVLEDARVSRFSVESRGSVIRVLDEETRAAWVAAAQPIWERFRAVIGAEYLDAAKRGNR